MSVTTLLPHYGTESMDLELPSYNQILQGNSSQPSRRQPQVEHTYHLSKGGSKWLTFRLHSRATHPDHAPSFLQGQTIAGSVSLNLKNEMLIRSITISLIGEISADCQRFLAITRQLCVSDSSEILPESRELPQVLSGKLVGSHSWPFSIRFPRGVCIISSDGARRTYRLPHSTGGKAQINYYLLVRVKRGTLRAGQRLIVPFTYTPQARPARPSILRQIAYLEDSPLIGPGGDPDGWRTLPSVNMSGKIFTTRCIEATCTLAIARPLCYTRGTVIPLSITVSTSDSQALDLLSAPSAPLVRLLRLSGFAPNILDSTASIAPWQSPPEIIGEAAWWPAPAEHSGLTSDMGRRSLYGEIKIPEDAPPNCLILNFYLQYSIAMFPSKAVAFAPIAARTSQLLSENVEIVTVHAEGPRPLTYLPPQYNRE